MCKDVPVLDGEKVVLKRMINGSLRLGQPERFGISAIRGDGDYGLDANKYIISVKIKGFESKLSLILEGDQISEFTTAIWHPFLEEERSKAIKELKGTFPAL